MILFLGADDLLSNEYVFKNLSEFAKQIPKSIDIIYGKVMSDEKMFGKKILNLKKASKKNVPLSSTTFIRRKFSKSRII